MTSQQAKRCEGVQVYIGKTSTVFDISLKTEKPEPRLRNKSMYITVTRKLKMILEDITKY